MNRLNRMAAAARRGAARLLPAGRRDWAAAVWAEAHEVPPGLARLAWRAGGVWMLAREALLPRRIGSAVLFAAAAAAAAWAAWPGSSASFATPGVRGYVIAMVLLLAGLPLLARPFLGPAGGSRAARFLRAGTCAALLAMMPAEATVYQFAETPPRGGTDLRLYLLIAWKVGGKEPLRILFLVLMALYVAAIFWMTSRRSRIAPATLAVGTGAGIALGLVMYAVAPLGLSKAATNPWLPGSDIDPLVLLAWLLLLGGPVTAAIVADRRFTASGSTPPPDGDRTRQMMAAGLLTSLVGALLVTVLGMGTTAVMLKEAWLRNWLYHGQHLLYGVQNLSADLRTLPAIAYSHQLTGSVDAGVLNAIIIFFPLIALAPTACAAVSRTDGAAPGQGDPRRGGGGPPGPGPAPDPPDGGQPAVTGDDAGLTVGLPGLHEPGPGIGQDRLGAALADAAVQPAGMR
jgi:hypothetical protein